MTSRIRHSLRPKDHFGRWGGEEFMIICSGTGIKDAEKIALRVKESIGRQPFEVVGMITASFGLSSSGAHLTLDAVIQRADAALYRAKANGRNRVEVDLDLVDVG
jgi:diguanylate cyclase (GGDEF)-like protein